MGRGYYKHLNIFNWNWYHF